MIRNGVTGFCLVFMVLALFLRFRLAFWVSLGIPISFLGTFWLMPGLDVSISMISLFAFIVVLGIVVDDAILIGENIHAHHERGTPGLKGLSRRGDRDGQAGDLCRGDIDRGIRPADFVEGNTGKIMKFIPLIVIPTLFFSLIESLFILQNISAIFAGWTTSKRARASWGRGAVFSTGSSQGWINSSFESTNPASVGVSSGVT